MLNDKNFNSWQENVMIVLGVMDLDLVLKVAQPANLMDQSLLKREKWKCGTVQIA